MGVEELLRLLAKLPKVDPPTRPPWLVAKQYILGDCKVGQQAQLLEDHGDATIHLALDRLVRDVNLIQVDPPLIGTVDPHENLHQCRFAGAILTEQGVDFAAVKFEVDIAKHFVFAEALRNTAHRDKRLDASLRPGCMLLERSPAYSDCRACRSVYC